MKRIILTTGGTGGHIFPALAVAEELRRRNPGTMLLFMGGQYGQEADLAANSGLDFVGLPVRGILGRGLKGIWAGLGMVRGLVKAFRVISRIKPELVVGFGGYAAFAGVLAARIAGSPTAIHEQNAYPGMTNRLLGKVVDRVFLSLPDASGAFDTKKTVLVGNPVRAAIAELYEKRLRETGLPRPGTDADEREEQSASGRGPGMSFYGGVDAPSPFDVAGQSGVAAASGMSGAAAPSDMSGEVARSGPPAEADATAKAASDVKGARESAATRSPRLLVMGGSLGARAINRTMIPAVGALREAGIEIWHQTGASEYESVRAAYREAGADHVRVEPFIADMQRAYAWADLVLCRAGGSSMAEITAAGLPAILVPLPKAAQDHQRHNARFLEREGGAVVLEQERFYSEHAGAGKTPPDVPDENGGKGDFRVLARTIISLFQDRQALDLMARKSLAAARPYAARALVDGLEALLADNQPRRAHAQQS